jgi:hypothetical protein
MTATLTKDPISASATELALMHTKTQASTLAILPAPILYIAAQFASKDEAKQVLQCINVRTSTDGNITIESTDGHRAFRFTIPCGDLWHTFARDIKLNSATLRKRISYAHFAVVKNSGVIDFLGGKISKGKDHPPTTFIESRLYEHAGSAFTFPSIDSIWPDKFNNQPQAPIAFNASYLASFLDEVTRYSYNGVVKMETNAPSNPLVFTCKPDLHGLTDCLMEYLLMPVQLRD